MEAKQFVHCEDVSLASVWLFNSKIKDNDDVSQNIFIVNELGIIIHFIILLMSAIHMRVTV